MALKEIATENGIQLIQLGNYSYEVHLLLHFHLYLEIICDDVHHIDTKESVILSS